MTYSPLTEQPSEKDINVVLNSTTTFTIRIDPFTNSTQFKAFARSKLTGASINLEVEQEGMNSGYVRMNIPPVPDTEVMGFLWQLQRKDNPDDWKVVGRGSLNTIGVAAST